MRQYLSMALLLVGLALVPVTAQAQVINSQGFNTILWGPSSSLEGISQYTINASAIPGQRYVNVVSNTGDWVVQNLPVGFGGSSDTVATNIDTSLTAGSLYQTTFDTAPQNAAPSFAAGVPIATGGNVNYLSNDPNGKAGFGTFTTTGGPVGNLPGAVFAAPINFSYHTGVPDLAQGVNECGPTSAANSLTWLNNTYNLGLTQTTAQIRDTLKDANHMKTNPATGTEDPDFVAGKNKYVQENGLPIVTHVVGGGAALGGRAPGLGVAPSGANILTELQAGQDVELSVIWAAGGGHWVTLVGAINVGGAFGVWYNDPGDNITGTRFSWLDSVGVGGGLRVRGFGAANTVDLTIAESIAPEPSPLPLLCLGILGLALVARRKSRSC